MRLREFENLTPSLRSATRVVCTEFDTHHHSLSWRVESIVEAIQKLALRTCRLRTVSRRFLERLNWELLARATLLGKSCEIRNFHRGSRERAGVILASGLQMRH